MNMCNILCGDKMLVAFGHGKCPLCGNIGKDTGKKMLKCRRCEISFNEFFISSKNGLTDYTDLHWN